MKLNVFQNKKPKVIVFDFDGVLVNSIPIKAKVFYELFFEYGKNTQKFSKEFHLQNIGLNRKQKFINTLKFSGEKKITNKKLMNLNKNFNKIYNKYFDKIKFNKIYYNFLCKHQKKYFFYILSTAPIEEIMKILKNNNIKNLFTKIYGSKIKKDLTIKKIIKDNNINKENLIYIGDSIHDLNAAKKLNIKFIAYKLNVKEKTNIKTINHARQFKQKIYEYSLNY